MTGWLAWLAAPFVRWHARWKAKEMEDLAAALERAGGFDRQLGQVLAVAAQWRARARVRW